MVNYVLSFCKITGASKIFKRNFYLPLLKPLTPREAFRTFRITGKWLLGAKIQHYIPVLLNHRKKQSKKSKNYGKNVHNEMDDYTYMTPVLDPDNDNHKVLIQILETKDCKGVFVYTVEDKQYNIVLQAQLESAIRDGDVIDLLVSQKNDKIIIKLKNFKKIPVEIEYYDPDGEQLYSGEGATTEEDEKFHHHGKYTMGLAKIFEDKETLEEEWEEVLKRVMRKRKRNIAENTKEYKMMVKDNLKNLDWDKFEEDAKKVIEEISEPAEEQPIEMEIDNLEKTKNVNETIKNNNFLDQLPTINEISEVIKNMGSALFYELCDDADETKRISGVKVKLASGKECFISGQMVHTDDGDVFVPGQTIENKFGFEYSPGITINVNNKPTLISGLIMAEEERDAMFLPTQSTITSDGQLTFALTSEERPPPQTEEQVEIRKQKRIRRNAPPETKVEDIPDDDGIEDFVMLDLDDSISDNDDVELLLLDQDDSDSIELSNSELEEIDIEAIRLKQEQQRLELEKLKMILLDDGMNELIESLEEKKRKLQQKLQELRNLTMQSEDNLISYATESDATEIAEKVTENRECINRLVDILLTMTRRVAAFVDRNKVNSDNINSSYMLIGNDTITEAKFNAASKVVKIILKSAVVAANDVFKNRPKDQILALNAIGEILIDNLNKNDPYCNEVMDLMNTPTERYEMCNIIFKHLTYDVTNSKLNNLHKLIDTKNVNISEFLNIVEKVIGKENENIYTAFSKLTKLDFSIANYVVEKLNTELIKAKTDEDAEIILTKAIIHATRFNCNMNFEKFISESKEQCLKELVDETICFAKALGLLGIEDILSKLTTKNVYLLEEEEVENFVKRVLLIRQLAERDYSLKNAIARIKKNWERARFDPRIRQLVRESGALITIEKPLRTSRDIPLHVMKSQNLLAIEDFIIQRTNVVFPVLISRNDLQAVIPKESARGVLAGRVPYVLIDESGVTNFKPMNMFNSMNLNKNCEKRIGDYLNVGGYENSENRDGNRAYLGQNVRNVKDELNNNRRRAA